jgi:hypothetical protein
LDIINWLVGWPIHWLTDWLIGRIQFSVCKWRYDYSEIERDSSLNSDHPHAKLRILGFVRYMIIEWLIRQSLDWEWICSIILRIFDEIDFCLNLRMKYENRCIWRSSRRSNLRTIINICHSTFCINVLTFWGNLAIINISQFSPLKTDSTNVLIYFISYSFQY